MSSSKLQRWLKYWADKFADLLFPPHCLSCGKSASWLCVGCEKSFKILPLGWCGTCGRVGNPNQTICRRCLKNIGLSSLLGCYKYRDSFERYMRAIKFQPAAIGVDVLLGLEIPKERSDIGCGSILIPIPCNPENESRRGFNQAERLAEQILANHPDALILDCLKITRVVKAQVGQTAKLRKESSMDLYRWSGPRLNGKTCVLIDDVCTTGATLSDAARALREVGARGVNAFVLAQTPPKRDQNQSITT